MFFCSPLVFGSPVAHHDGQWQCSCVKVMYKSYYHWPDGWQSAQGNLPFHFPSLLAPSSMEPVFLESGPPTPSGQRQGGLNLCAFWITVYIIGTTIRQTKTELVQHCNTCYSSCARQGVSGHIRRLRAHDSDPPPCPTALDFSEFASCTCKSH